MIGIICALAVEVEGLKKIMTDTKTAVAAKTEYLSGTVGEKEIVCCECGVGKVNAAMCAQAMIDLFHPDVIVNSGIAGSLSKDIAIGDIVISDDCVQHDYDGTEMGDPPGEIWYADEKRVDIPADKKTADILQKACETLENTQIFRGRIATGDTFVAAHERREKIAETFHALACEMEGGAVAQVCYRNEVPFSILRCISDDFGSNMFMDYLEFRDLAAEKSIAVLKNFIEAV